MSEKHANFTYCSPRQKDGGSVFCKSELRYSNMKMYSSIHAVKGFDRMETGLCGRNSLLCPDRPSSGTGFPPSFGGGVERPWRELFLFTFACEMLHQIGQQGSARWCFSLPFFSLDCGAVAELFWDVFFFLPRTFLQWYLSTSGFRSSAVWTFTPPPTISTPAHSYNSSCAVLGGYYTSRLFSFTAAAELCWLAFLGYVLHHQ